MPLTIFDNRNEQEAFKAFARANWSQKEEYATDIWIPHMEQIKDYNMEAFKEEYRNVQILRRMLEEFRNNT